MNAGKKIFFLCLALILLIILCVYTHLEKLNSQNSLKEEVALKPILEKKVQKENISSEQKTITNDFIKTEKIVEDNSSKIVTTEKIQTQKQQTKEPKKEISEKTEDEPLINTDKRYKRSGNEKPIEQMSINTQLLQIKIRDYVTKYPITFETSSNKITKKSLSTISTVIKMLKNHPNLKIEIAGHTDASGSKRTNKALSVARAVAVKKQMINYGFNKNKIKARGYAGDIPIVENNEKGYSKINRRVEFNIIEE